jgi:hypothetical protein
MARLDKEDWSIKLEIKVWEWGWNTKSSADESVTVKAVDKAIQAAKALVDTLKERRGVALKAEIQGPRTNEQIIQEMDAQVRRNRFGRGK